MRGEGIAFGAISIVNGIPTGIGASAGIELKVHVKAEIIEEDTVDSSIKVTNDDIPIDDKLVKSAFKVLKDTFKFQGGLHLDIISEIPISRGLKSSSAVANAIMKASLKALEIELEEIEIVKLGVKAAMDAGVTITGAFDDACASMFGGVYITNNFSLKILKAYDIEERKVVILVPPRYTPKASIDKEAFKKVSELMKIPIDLAFKKQWKKALTMNGLITSLPLQINIKPVWDALKAGAEAAGITGTGPAIVAVTDDPNPIIDEWEKYEGKILLTKTRGFSKTLQHLEITNSTIETKFLEVN
jgi:shikimate kinase